jgi:hypothetical protein
MCTKFGEKDMMKIDGSGSLAQELRELAAAVSTLHNDPERATDRSRLQDLGLVILIAADMAAKIDTPANGVTAQSPETVDALSDDILHIKWLEGLVSMEKTTI